jgi:hypothetical protein
VELLERGRGFSLDALIAEAKRRARNRRMLVLMALLAVAAVAAAVALGSPGGGSRPAGAGGRGGSSADASHSVQIGPFSVSVPRGFHALTGSSTALTVASAVPLAPNGVELDVDYLSSVRAPAFKTTPLPLDLRKLHTGDSGRTWNGVVSGGGSDYSVLLYLGKKAPAADRAAILRALGSIHRTR